MSCERHNYEYEVDMSSQTAPANVIRMVGENKRVLEIGCGPGSITKLLVKKGLCQVTGLELDPDAIKRVAPYCERVMQVDLNSSGWPTLLENCKAFDVVVAADVLEHLYDPWATLKRMVSLISQNGYLVISLPHVGHAAIASCLIDGDFNYRDCGLLDRTHIRFFGLKNIEDLFKQAGLKIIEVAYVVKLPEDTEFAHVWAKLGSEVRAVLESSPHAHVYQVVLKAVPVDYHGEEIRLVPPPPWRPLVFSPSMLKSRLAAKLGPKTKHRIRRLLGAVGIRV